MMAYGKLRDPRKEQHWRRLIQLWKNSGLTVRAFCVRHHITPPSFYAWRRKLQQRDSATTFVPVQVATDDQPASSTPIDLFLTDGRSVRITPGFDPATLRQLLALVRQHLRDDPLSGHVYGFRNRRSDRIKLLYWDSDGYVIVYKRLEAGTFRFPPVAEGQAGVTLRAAE
jgi:transposase